MVYQDGISVRAFAKLIKRSDTQVRRLMQAGKLTADDNKQLSPTINMKEWEAISKEETTKPTKITKTTETKKPKQRTYKTDLNELFDLAEENPAQALNKAKALETIYKVEERQLSLDKEKGKLVEIETVKATFKDIAIKVRQEILAIPQRYAGRLEGRNEREIETMLEEALAEAMTKMQLDL